MERVACSDDWEEEEDDDDKCTARGLGEKENVHLIDVEVIDHVTRQERDWNCLASHGKNTIFHFRFRPVHAQEFHLHTSM